MLAFLQHTLIYAHKPNLPLVAGCSAGHKPLPLHVSKWDTGQTRSITPSPALDQSCKASVRQTECFVVFSCDALQTSYLQGELCHVRRMYPDRSIS